jgi:hypothetical protein
VKGVLRSRLLSAADSAACAQWLTNGLLIPLTLAAGLGVQLAELLRRDQIKALAIEELSPATGGWIYRGLGVSGFVVPALIDAHIAAPKPFLFADLLHQAAAGAHVFLAPAEIGRANADGSLDLVVEYMQGGWDYADPFWRSVAVISHETYVKHHRGYHMRRVLSEFWTAHSETYLTAGYRVLQTFDLSAEQLRGIKAGFDTRRTLCYADGSGAPGLTVTNAFQFAAPSCGFTYNEQRVLLSAADGLSDTEIAEALGWSANSVKLAWRTIYKRVQAHAPFVLMDADGREKDGRRGPEKRRHVLAFVVRHPEELRPYHHGRRNGGA